MSELTTKRTLVKSPPELWAEVSDLEALAKHLGEFGDIRITRLEPETTVAWEGDRISGTVQLEPSGWGTKVTLTAELATIVEEPPPSPIQETPEPEPAPELVEPGPEPEPEPEPEPAPIPQKIGFWARVFGRRKPVTLGVPAVEEPEPEPEPVEEPPAPPLQPVPDPEPPAEPEPEDPLPAAIDDDRATAVLTEVLDNLGSAHHRPFSRG